MDGCVGLKADLRHCWLQSNFFLAGLFLHYNITEITATTTSTVIVSRQWRQRQVELWRHNPVKFWQIQEFADLRQGGESTEFKDR